MPKVRIGPAEDPRRRAVKAVIEYGMAQRGVKNRKPLCAKAHVSESTLSNHINHPEDMRLGELWAVLDYLKVPQEERTKIL